MQQQQHHHHDHQKNQCCKKDFSYYAGAGFENSPPASQLPLPPIDWVCAKKNISSKTAMQQQLPKFSKHSYPAQTCKIKRNFF